MRNHKKMSKSSTRRRVRGRRNVSSDMEPGVMDISSQRASRGDLRVTEADSEVCGETSMISDVAIISVEPRRRSGRRVVRKVEELYPCQIESTSGDCAESDCALPVKVEEWDPELVAEASTEVSHPEGDSVSARGSIAASQVRRRRGSRKSKPVRRLSPKDPNVSTVCVHCKEEFESTRTLSLHMLEHHHMQWSPDNPAGVYKPEHVFQVLKCINCLVCGEKFTGRPGFYKHRKWCGRENETQICDICEEEVSAMNMNNHMRDHENAKLDTLSVEPKEEEEEEEVKGPGRRPKRRSARKALRAFKTSDYDDVADDGSDSNDPEVQGDDSDSEDDDDDDDVSSGEDLNSLSGASFCKSRPVSTAEVTADTWPFYPYCESCHIAATEWSKMYEFKDLFPEWRPSETNWIPGADGKVHEWDFQKEAFCGTVNTGGSIWKLEWCPTVLSKGGRRDNFLAVCHGQKYGYTLEGIRCMDTICNQIQIWNCGPLKNDIHSMELSFTIDVEGCGRIWDIKWCPSGALQGSGDESNCLDRMGLLAVACDSGIIQVLSIPQPGKLSQELGINYIAKPCVTLKKSTKPCECLTLDWSRKDRCGTICAGFADGTVAVWHLYSCSSLLTQGSVRYAAHIFQAHIGAVTGLSFCPNDPQFLVSCSPHSKEALVWDLSDTEVPFHEWRTVFRPVTVQWPLNWLCIIVTTDFTESNLGNPTCQVFLGPDCTYRYMYRHASCVWSVDYSPFLNALVACDNGGWVLGLPMSSAIGREPERHTRKMGRLWPMDHPQSMTGPQCLNDTRSAEEKFKSDDALHCVRFNCNYSSRAWVACGGVPGTLWVKKFRYLPSS